MTCTSSEEWFLTKKRRNKIQVNVHRKTKKYSHKYTHSLQESLKRTKNWKIVRKREQSLALCLVQYLSLLPECFTENQKIDSNIILNIKQIRSLQFLVHGVLQALQSKDDFEFAWNQFLDRLCFLSIQMKRINQQLTQLFTEGNLWALFSFQLF